MGILSEVDDKSREDFLDEEESRADSVAALTPEEKRWISRFKRICRDMPATIHVLVSDGSGATVFRGKAEHGCEVASVCALRLCQLG